MIKKIISILLLTFMLGSMLTGCDGLPFGDERSEINDNEQQGGNKDDGKKDSEPTINPKPDPQPDPNPNPDPESQPDPNPNPETQSSYTVGTKVGNLFGDVTLETLDGGTVSTADFRGKIVILNIWATRCPPCKAELPDFDKIASEYEGEVVIIAAHEDYTKSSVPSYAETNFPDSKIIFAYDTPHGDAYYAAGGDGYIPQTAIIDQNGVILYSDSGILSHDTLVSIIEAAK